MIDHVVDGDTVDVRIDGRTERVRLIGINTPETKDPRRPVECYGPEASALTTLLLPAGTGVRLERDVEARDDYGRLLAYVRRSDGLFVNLELARQGAAVVLSIRPNTAYAAVIAAAADEARRARSRAVGRVPFLPLTWGAPGRPPGAVGRPTDSVGPCRTTTGRRWSSASATGPRTSSSSSAATTSARATP